MAFPLSSLLFFSILSLFFPNPTSAQCLDDQKSSLQTLFISTQNLSWKPNTDCCEWDGVTCDFSTGHVIGLDLTNRSIRSPVNSTVLISLSRLRTLNLSFNFFNFTIPSGLGGLAGLTHLNLSNSGFKGLVPVEISRMKSLVSLDLSTSLLYSFSSLVLPSPDFGYLVGNLSGLRELYLDGVTVSSPVPELLGGLDNLTSLHLSSCNLTGVLPEKILQLRNLESLDLSSNPLLTGTLPEFPWDNKLRNLLLFDTKFSGELGNSFGNLRFLRRLRLGGCNFSGPLPASFVGIGQLVHLDIKSNGFTGVIPSLHNLSQLVHLDLSSNKLSGEIPSLENLRQIVKLGLSSNRFGGQIPSIASLRSVVEIVLSNNNLSGPINSSYGEGLQNLIRLDLHNNSLSGKIPSSLFMLPSLQSLDLSNNQFNDQLDNFSNASLSLLNTVDLSNNMLQGPIPRSVFQLKELKILMLFSNNFTGTIDLAMIQNMMNLSSLDLSDNLLLVNTSGSNTSSFPQVATLKLRSCSLTQFPHFLRNQSKLYTLDLSNNKINGEIPNWIWKIGNGSLNYMNLSHNMIAGLEQPPIDLSSSKLIVLDLHLNMIQGSIPFPPPSAVILDYSLNNFTSVIPTNISSYLNFTIFFSLSSNKITGKLPSSICNASFLQVLDLSNNNLSGLIPVCVGQMGNNLQVLNIGRNKFSGTIPQTFVDGCSLRTLDMNENQLEGSLPRSLANCMQLEVLNLGNNKINDTFPSWLWSLPQLRVLILRSNKLYGPIGRPDGPEHTDVFPLLQIIDLSFNGFVGNLSSKCLQSWKGMMNDEDQEQSNHHRQIINFGYLVLNPLYYQESITFTIRGFEIELLKILTIFTSVDLSSNSFQGNIPEEIGNLKYLHFLNMSHNKFSGPMPSSIGNLSQLESLDLSVNQLSGEIPKDLTALTFLSVLNLSQNHFMGSIPQGNQFSTFSNDSFEGNLGLCGPPLSRSCQKAEAPSSFKIADFPSQKEFNWQFIWIGLGYGGGIGMIFCPLVFWRKGRRWYNKYVDKILFMVIPTCTWFLIDCKGEKIEPEEGLEQELIEFASDMEEEGEPCQQHFCVFCTVVDLDWKRAIHRECCCPYASPLFSYQDSQISRETADEEKDAAL